MSKTAPAIPSEEVICRTLSEFQVRINAEQALKIQQYMRMLLVWNEKINLTAIRDPQEILSRHFGEAMFAASAVPLEKGRLADVGSGGGFPGLPLRIICPELQVFLVESNVKKATFLAEVVRELQLSDTRVLVSRYEELGEELAPLDFVCTRALGEFGSFLSWAGSLQIAAREAVLWVGGRDLNEIRELKGWEWREPIPIPQSLQRFLLIGGKQI